jgi:hypothetical protein
LCWPPVRTGLSDSEWPRCGDRLRPQLSPKNARFYRDGRAGRLVRPVDESDVLAMLPQDRKAALSKRIAKATGRAVRNWYPKLVEQVGGQTWIHDTPPTIFHADAARGAGNLN